MGSRNLPFFEMCSCIYSFNQFFMFFVFNFFISFLLNKNTFNPYNKGLISLYTLTRSINATIIFIKIMLENVSLTKKNNTKSQN